MATAASKLTLASAATVRIDKGVPLPSKSSGRPRGSKYPFAEMEVGDSFFVPVDGSDRARPQTKLSAHGASFAKSRGSGVKFSTRMVEGGVRVWRTA